MPQPSDAFDRFYSVIPAGGIGSRLWPLSRADAPKFLHDLTGSGQTLLRDTWDRLAPLSGDQRIMVVTGRAHRAAVEAQSPELADHNVVLESEPRESTAAIGLAAAILEKREPGVIIGSFAADHVINGAALFIARADRLLEEIGAAEPELLAGLLELAEAWDTPRRGAVVDQVWPRLKKIAIDYSVAEPVAATGKLAVIPGQFDWDDVGDFASIAKLHSGGRKAYLAILGEGARVLADSSSGIGVSHA